LNGGLHAPCVHAGGLVASSQTTASWVADLRPDACRHWVTATAAPCTGLFKPVSVAAPVALGAAPGAHADDSLWWRHERLHRAVLRDPARLGQLYSMERAALEASWLAEPPDSQAAFDEASRLTQRWTESVCSVATADIRSRFVQRYWIKQNAAAQLELDLANGREPAGVGA
jgi:hypothetical protein